jgi:hypothetical protein
VASRAGSAQHHMGCLGYVGRPTGHGPPPLSFSSLAGWTHRSTAPNRTLTSGAHVLSSHADLVWPWRSYADSVGRCSRKCPKGLPARYAMMSRRWRAGTVVERGDGEVAAHHARQGGAATVQARSKVWPFGLGGNQRMRVGH